MTKKHFAQFAELMKADLDCARTRFSADEYKRTFDAVTYAAHAFATVAATDNPRFDRDRFLSACGIK